MDMSQGSTSPNLQASGSGGDDAMGRMMFHMGHAETILFSFWRPEDINIAGLLISCAAIVVMCFLVELVRFLRTYNDTQRIPVHEKRLRLAPRFSCSVLVDAFLHLIQLIFSYFLMLTFMTFNVWLCISVVLGEVGSRLLFNILFPRYESSPPSFRRCS
ncbi:Ctr copper transporter family protein [Ancylostoma caninum]|uniref:Copper transport protein n=1 Tax=Ancylostoma caninum TaxID=29170 RepID=A0A368FD73_ANCCA|nr:Ctr copper transporter family protein [Ancylostoma caninum]